MKRIIIMGLLLGMLFLVPSVFADSQKTLVFNGTGEWTNYEVKVSGDIQEKEGITGEDDLYVGGAKGAVSEGADQYSFTGNITNLTLGSPESIVVTINGREIEYSDYKKTSEQVIENPESPNSNNKTNQNSTTSASENSTNDGGKSYDEIVDNYSDGSDNETSFPLFEVVIGGIILGILLIAGLVFDEMDKQWKCNNCGHQWRSRNTGGEPPYCPKCRDRDIEKVL